MKETLINIILFIPLGMYLKYLFQKSNLVNLAIIALTSFIFETFQYVFHIGVSDITDIMMNTLGGFIGLNIIILILFIIKKSNLKFLKRLIEYILIFIPVLMLATLFLI